MLTLTMGFPAADIVASICGSEGRVVNSSQGTDGSIGLGVDVASTPVPYLVSGETLDPDSI